MKKITFIAAICGLICTLGTTNTALAQKKLTEGKIAFDISYPDAGEMDPNMASMMATDMTMYVKNDLSRMEMAMGPINVTVIANAKEEGSTMLMDMMGNKMAVKMEKEKDAKEADIQVKETTETKTIAGYKCTKAEVTMNGKTSAIWYTTDIEAKTAGRGTGPLKKIKGFPMEYEITQGMGNTTMHMTAKTVSAIPVSDDNFKIPADYKVTSQEEFRKMFGGGGQ